MIIALLKMAWITLTTSVLIITLFNYADHHDTNIAIFLIYGMLVLSAPIGLLISGAFTILIITQESFQIDFLDSFPSDHIGLTVLWILFFVAGYIQWFFSFRDYGKK